MLQDKLTELNIQGPYPGINGTMVFDLPADKDEKDIEHWLTQNKYIIRNKFRHSDGLVITYVVV
jgi:hypothetical protein